MPRRAFPKGESSMIRRAAWTKRWERGRRRVRTVARLSTAKVARAHLTVCLKFEAEDRRNVTVYPLFPAPCVNLPTSTVQSVLISQLVADTPPQPAPHVTPRSPAQFTGNDTSTDPRRGREVMGSIMAMPLALVNTRARHIPLSVVRGRASIAHIRAATVSPPRVYVSTFMRYV